MDESYYKALDDRIALLEAKIIGGSYFNSLIEECKSLTPDLTRVQELLKIVNVNLKDSNGMTPLMHVATSDVAKMLVDHGADLNSTDPLGNTALIHQTLQDHPEVCKFILTNVGVDVNHPNTEGANAFSIARQRDYAYGVIVNTIRKFGGKPSQTL